MTPLIFTRLQLAWGDLVPPGAITPPPEVLASVPLSTFPGPVGRHRPVTDATVRPDGVSFASWGPYRLIGGFGALKLLLLDPATPPDDVPLKMLAFVASNHTHCGRDCYLGYVGIERAPFRYERLAEKLFRSDQPIGTTCGFVSKLLAVLLRSRGYQVRIVGVEWADPGGHQAVECYFPDLKRWVWLDADFGIVMRHAGALIGSAELLTLVAVGREAEIEVVDMAPGKLWPIEATMPTKGGVGQIVWRGSHGNPADRAAERFRWHVIEPRPFDRIVSELRAEA